MSGLDDPYPEGDWEAYRAARNRFLARVRPESMDEPPPMICPDVVPEEWNEAPEHGESTGGGSH